MSLTKVFVNSNDENFVLVDTSAIKGLYVQYPEINETSLHLSADAQKNNLGVVKIYLTHMTHPFQFTRNTSDEINDLVSQLNLEVI